MRYENIPTNSNLRVAVNKFLQKNNLTEINNQSIVYSCISSGGIVGCLTLNLNPFHPNTYHLEIFVDRQFRRQGIGSRLLSKASTHHDEMLRVGVDSSNEIAILFLKANNFKRKIRCYLPEYKKNDLIIRRAHSRLKVQKFQR